MDVGISEYLALSTILFVIGAYGVLTRKNLIIVLMSLEIMLNAVNLTFIVFSRVLGEMTGHVFMFMTLTVAASEAAVGLAIVVALFSHRESVNIDILSLLKG